TGPEAHQAKRDRRKAFEVFALINPAGKLASHRDLVSKAGPETLDSEIAHYEPKLDCAETPSKLRSVVHEVLDLFAFTHPQVFGHEAECASKHLHLPTEQHAQIEWNKQPLMRIHHQGVGAVRAFQHPAHLGHDGRRSAVSGIHVEP